MNAATLTIRPGTLALAAVTALAVGIAAAAAEQTKTSDQEQLEALVLEYTRLEDAGDMASQAKLMMPDRWWHGVGGRRTDNALYMKMQEQAITNGRKRYPGLAFMREARDLRVQVLAPTVAITSFTWFVNRLVPPDLPADKVQALGPPPIPNTVSLVWVRQTDGWKIASTHMSPLYLRP